MSDNSSTGNLFLGFILAIIVLIVLFGGFYILRNGNAAPANTGNKISGSITLPTSLPVPGSNGSTAK